MEQDSSSTSSLYSKLTLFQEKLQNKLHITELPHPPKIVGGVDVSYCKNRKFGCATISIVDLSTLQLLELQTACNHVKIPYIPGLLAFRELPLILQAWKKIQHHPDVLLVDGQGLIHPRRMGLATHLGILLEIPTIGVAKSKFIGQYTLPGPEQGEYTFVKDNSDIIGVSLRTKPHTKPIYVSIGNLITLEEAITIVLRTIRSRKLPIPIIIADEESRKAVKLHC